MKTKQQLLHHVDHLRMRFHKTRLTKDIMVCMHDLSAVLDYFADVTKPKASDAETRPDVLAWQESQREFFQQNVLDVVTEYANWRDANEKVIQLPTTVLEPGEVFVRQRIKSPYQPGDTVWPSLDWPDDNYGPQNCIYVEVKS